MLLASFEIMDYITFAAMIVGFITMVWGIQNVNKNANGRLAMIAGAVLVFGGVIAFFYTFFFTDAKTKRVNQNAHIFLEAKAEKAATYIADRFPDGGAVGFIIDESTYNDSESDNNVVMKEIQRLLSERGFTCDEVIIVGESKEVVDKKTGESSVVNEDPTDGPIMEKKLKPFVDKFDMVINFVGLPESLSEVKLNYLTRKNNATGKNNMMLMCDTGLAFVPQEMLKKSRVCAIIDYVSYAGNEFDIQEKKVKKDEAFDMMYYFVNADTLESYISDNPDYFIAK